ncbi:MAG TPA: glycosyltransferase [Rhodocyclaceae bacterium]
MTTAEANNHYLRSWTDTLLRNSDEPAVWYRLSQVIALIDTEQRRSWLDHIDSLQLPTPHARFYQKYFRLTYDRTPANAACAADALEQLPQFCVNRAWHFVRLLWSFSFGLTGNASSREFLQAGKARRWIQRIANHLDSELLAPCHSQAKPDSVSQQRVAIVTPYLARFKHGATRLALEHSALLHEAGHDVAVFAAQDSDGFLEPYWLGSAFVSDPPPPAPETWRVEAVDQPVPLRVWCADELLPVEHRWKQTVEVLTGFAPQVVLYIGFCSPLLDLISRRFATVALSLHSLPPLGDADVWLHSCIPPAIPTEPWQSTDRIHPYLYPFRIPRSKPQQADWRQRLQLGRRNVLITIGARLSYEIRPEWCAEVRRRLQDKPDWVWLLLGESREIAGVSADDKNVLKLDHLDDVPGLLLDCSIYLNPPRPGGGFSVLEAMAAGIPVVSMLDGDGGNKLGELAVQHEQDYWQLLDDLMDSPDRRKSLGAMGLDRYETYFNLRNSGRHLLDAFKLAEQRFQIGPYGGRP